MFDEACVVSQYEVEASAHVGGWREADRELRRIARRRTVLDLEEAGWLLVARQENAHRELGFATFLEYLEQVLGHRPRAAEEPLRVAEAIQELPVTRAALGGGDVSYSAVRELTRVVTPETELAWLAAARDKTVREIEAMLRGRKRGDTPDTPPAADPRPQVLRFEVSPQTQALLFAARRRLHEETGHYLEDDEFLAAMARSVLEPALAPAAEVPPSHYQVAITVCRECDRGWQDGAGGPVEVDATVVAKARCDAQDIGDVHSGPRTRATRTIPPAVRRRVWRRDRGRCTVPGCRSTRFLEVHHLTQRAHGGGHHPTRLTLLCSGHHDALHAGTLVITGDAPRLQYAHVDGRPWGAAPS